MSEAAAGPSIPYDVAGFTRFYEAVEAVTQGRPAHGIETLSVGAASDLYFWAQVEPPGADAIGPPTERMDRRLICFVGFMATSAHVILMGHAGGDSRPDMWMSHSQFETSDAEPSGEDIDRLLNAIATGGQEGMELVDDPDARETTFNGLIKRFTAITDVDV